MKLSTMQTVVATVNAQGESDLANPLLSAWAHDDEPAKYWRASANFVFFFQQAGQPYVLRFNHASERTRDYIQAEIDYVTYLAMAGIVVAKPIRSLAGNYVESIPTALGLFHGVVFEALPGELLAFDTVTPAQFSRWGRALGELHQAAQGYEQKGRPTWADHVAMVAETLPADEQAAHQALAEVHSHLIQRPVTQQNFGLIHYDFELDNLVWQAEQPGLIDFDDCAWYWFAADIAFALRDLFGDSATKIELQHPSLQQFIAGYRSVKPLDPAELDQLPHLMRLHNLISFAKLHRALAPGPSVDDPAWSIGLRQRLLTKMQFYRDEFSLPI